MEGPYERILPPGADAAADHGFSLEVAPAYATDLDLPAGEDFDAIIDARDYAADKGNSARFEGDIMAKESTARIRVKASGYESTGIVDRTVGVYGSPDGREMYFYTWPHYYYDKGNPLHGVSWTCKADSTLDQQSFARPCRTLVEMTTVSDEFFNDAKCRSGFFGATAGSFLGSPTAREAEEEAEEADSEPDDESVVPAKST